jgi:hypothetical protein
MLRPGGRQDGLLTSAYPASPSRAAPLPLRRGRATHACRAVAPQHGAEVPWKAPQAHNGRAATGSHGRVIRREQDARVCQAPQSTMVKTPTNGVSGCHKSHHPVLVLTADGGHLTWIVSPPAPNIGAQGFLQSS